MRSLKFPSIFNTNNSKVWKESEYNQATTQDVIVLLQTQRGELFGDPYFGLLLKQYFYDQNGPVLKDMLIDMIYTQVATFLPQVHVERKNIDIVQDREKGKVYINFSGINQIDYKHNTYSLLLFENKENK